MLTLSFDNTDIEIDICAQEELEIYISANPSMNFDKGKVNILKLSLEGSL